MTKKIVEVEADYTEFKNHISCTHGGMYIFDCDDGSFEFRCVSRLHGGDNLLILKVPAANTHPAPAPQPDTFRSDAVALAKLVTGFLGGIVGTSDFPPAQYIKMRRLAEKLAKGSG